MSKHALALAAALATLPALAQEQRPDESSLFGGESASPSQEAPRPSEDSLFGDAPAEPSSQAPASQATADNQDAQGLDAPLTRSAFDTEQAVDDPLKIGGRFYQRLVATSLTGLPVEGSLMSAPTLVDGYLDARPMDRLRAYVLARMTFDATSAGFSLGANSTTPTLATAPVPNVLLDQAWLRFDIERTLFITVGRQHVKWGTARFWNPTDVLTPQRRDALALFDPRTGASMIKLHVPWEAKGWNFYAIGLLDNAGPANVLGRVGGATRAEVVLGPAELGATAIFQYGQRNRFGLDFSSALGPLDVYGEFFFVRGSAQPLYRLPQGTTFAGLLLDARDPDGLANLDRVAVEAYTPKGLNPQISGGATWTFAYAENETATVGVEYFYNSLGYDSPELYPYLLFRGQYQGFYVGQHYAALYALVAGPGNWDNTSFVVSNLGNLSDRTFISRLDVIHRLFNFLQVEMSAAVFYGQEGGEFRLAFNLPPLRSGSRVTGPLFVPASTFQVALGLRLDI